MIPRLIPVGLLGSLLLSGCSLWQFPWEGSTERTELPQDPLATSRELVSAGRLGDALALLDAAIGQGRDTPAYQTAREQTLQNKARLEQRLLDRILIEQTKAQRALLAILDEWLRMDPNNSEVEDERETIRQSLRTYHQRLSDCGLRQIAIRPELARQCLELAAALGPTQQDRMLLEMLAQREQKTKQVKAQKQQDMIEQQRKDWIRNSLSKAEALYEKDQFDPARKLLNQVLEEEPGNAQAEQLLSQLEAHLQSHLENLLKTGDKLYQEGEIEGAQDIWEAALRLDPENPLAKEKLERSKRVLENLESLRKAEESKEVQQNP